MVKNDFSFDEWFENLKMHVLDKTGVEFTDPDSVKDDYENGRNVFDVVDEIAFEYNT